MRGSIINGLTFLVVKHESGFDVWVECVDSTKSVLFCDSAECIIAIRHYSCFNDWFKIVEGFLGVHFRAI